MTCYEDYYWSHGIPRGVGKCGAALPALHYKIVSDPYRKRISIERFTQNAFHAVVYDSALFDFRDLAPERQASWQKLSLGDHQALIRDHDDRTILFEDYTFTGGRCSFCKARSPHGPSVSEQMICYRASGDSFDGVVLWDSNRHPVILKKYKIDESSGEFSELIEEYKEFKPGSKEAEWLKSVLPHSN